MQILVNPYSTGSVAGFSDFGPQQAQFARQSPQQSTLKSNSQIGQTIAQVSDNNVGLSSSFRVSNGKTLPQRGANLNIFA